jgi:hypothetical protein
MARTLISSEFRTSEYLSATWLNNPTKVILVKADSTEYYVNGIYFNKQNLPYFVNVYADVTNNVKATSGIPVTEEDNFYLETP